MFFFCWVHRCETWTVCEITHSFSPASLHGVSFFVYFWMGLCSELLCKIKRHIWTPLTKLSHCHYLLMYWPLWRYMFHGAIMTNRFHFTARRLASPTEEQTHYVVDHTGSFCTQPWRLNSYHLGEEYPPINFQNGNSKISPHFNIQSIEFETFPFLWFTQPVRTNSRIHSLFEHFLSVQ